MSDWLDMLRFGADGLIPAVVQDAGGGEVLMLGYMNRESLGKTIADGRTCFWSRSRGVLWTKGETSGNYQVVKAVYCDCDRDALLIRVEQTGAACHTGHRSCFFTKAGPAGSPEEPKTAQDEESKVTQDAAPRPETPAGGDGVAAPPEEGASGVLSELYGVIRDRKARMPSGSYTASLMSGGKDRILKKVAEEAGEVILASKNDASDEIVREMADLWFHSLVVLGYHDIPLEAVYGELARRRRPT